MAIDDIITNLPIEADWVSIRGALTTYLNRRVLEDREFDLGFQSALKRSLKKRRLSKDGKDVPSGDLKDIRVSFTIGSVDRYKALSGIDNINTKESPMTNQELEFSRGELKCLVIDKFGEDYWEDWVSYRVHAESEQKVADYRGISRQAISKRVKKVDEFVRRVFN